MTSTVQPSAFLYATPARPDIRRTPAFTLLLTVCWLLSVTCLSIPGRAGPLDFGAVDWIALVKIAARGGSLLLLAGIVLRLHEHPRTGVALSRLIPLLLFALWCSISFLWSPLKAVTFGHAVELFTLVLLATVTAMLCSTRQAAERVLKHLFLTAMVLCAAILVLDYRAVISGARPAGYMHPNTLGAVASNGLVLLLGCRLLWNWAWTRRFSIPGFVICSSALYISRSRASLLATFVVLTILFLVRRKLLFLTVILALGGIMTALVPYVDAVNHVPDSIGSYILRGQTRADLAGASGRDELWPIAIRSFLDAPWFGHGYYMISSTGSFYVWHKQQFQTAHNLMLHLLTGTGLFGAALFSWGLGTPLRPCFANWRGMSEHHKIGFLVLLIFVWFLILGCFEISILGPLDPAVVLFFASLGLVAGNSE